LTVPRSTGFVAAVLSFFCACGGERNVAHTLKREFSTAAAWAPSMLWRLP
jgi:hypothetical protein